MRRLQWRSQALADLDRIHERLSGIENAKPDRAILRIRAAAESLRRLGDIGRPSRVQGLRERSVPRAPYVIAYKFADDAEKIAVYHHAQTR
jgi:plasmid stabilization system protein ParE